MKEWTEVYTILGKHMDLIIKGEKTVEDGLKEAQKELDEALSGK